MTTENAARSVRELAEMLEVVAAQPQSPDRDLEIKRLISRMEGHLAMRGSAGHSTAGRARAWFGKGGGGMTDAPNPGIAGYEQVHGRIRRFIADHPNGALQPLFAEEPHYRIEQHGDATLLVYGAKAYRDRDDALPGIGMAWEPIPGRTRFTRGTELMNAETSAWGRALAAVGYPGPSGVASAEEVAAPQAARDERKLAAPEAVRALLAEHFPRSAQANTKRLTAIHAAGLGYESVSAAVSGMTEAELETLRAHLEGGAES